MIDEKLALRYVIKFCKYSDYKFESGKKKFVKKFFIKFVNEQIIKKPYKCKLEQFNTIDSANTLLNEVSKYLKKIYSKQFYKKDLIIYLSISQAHSQKMQGAYKHR
jgi:hypothetical protein